MKKLETPKTWEKASLEDLIVYAIGGDWGKDPDSNEPGYSNALCIRGTEFKNWDVEKGQTAALRKIKTSSLQNRILIEGDILLEISGGGPEQPVGRSVLIDKTALSLKPDTPKICTNFFRLLRTAQEIDSKYLNHYLTFFYKSGEILQYQAGSNNLRNLKFNDYLGIKTPIPPLKEQRRIVAKIEELFSELDQGIASLKTAREQLKVYRQALLKHAFEGKLTAHWREKNTDKLESAEDLLARIQSIREKHCQKQLSDWQNGNTQGRKPRPPKTFESLSDEELSKLSQLPTGWAYIKLGMVIDEPAYGTSKKCDYGAGEVGVLRIPNIVSGRIDTSDLKFADFNEEEINNYQLNSGDILLIRSNGSISLVGRCAVIREQDKKFLFAGYLIRLRPNACLIDSTYLLSLFSSHAVRQQIEAKAKSTSGVNNINSGEIQSLIIPVCSFDEQKIIRILLEERLSVLATIEAEIEANIEKSEALRQSILKKAFSGQLVPQDANDEPASILLERIKAEKAMQQATKPAAKPKQQNVKHAKASADVIPLAADTDKQAAVGTPSKRRKQA